MLVVLAILFLLAMALFAALPRRRETARVAGCRRNLMQIGIALELYGKAEGSLPTVPRLGIEPVPNGGPLGAILEALVLPDLNGLSDVSKPPPARPGEVPGERPVQGFVCPSDRDEPGPERFPAPVSYRATTGDTPQGSNGGFAPGQTVRLAEIEAGDGRGYTAAFSERLLGKRRPGFPGPSTYSVVPGPLADQGCPGGPPGSRRGDAGWSWAEASWRSTLYTHALAPGARQSCIAEDGRSALMGASSGHSSGVGVLIFDGSVRTVSLTIAPEVWKALATFRSVRPDDNPPPGGKRFGPRISVPTPAHEPRAPNDAERP